MTAVKFSGWKSGKGPRKGLLFNFFSTDSGAKGVVVKPRKQARFYARVTEHRPGVPCKGVKTSSPVSPEAAASQAVRMAARRDPQQSLAL